LNNFIFFLLKKTIVHFQELCSYRHTGILYHS